MKIKIIRLYQNHPLHIIIDLDMIQTIILFIILNQKGMVQKLISNI